MPTQQNAPARVVRRTAGTRCGGHAHSDSHCPERSADFWVDVLCARLHHAYSGTSVVLRFAGSWVLLVSGDRDQVSHAITVRVADCQASYRALLARGMQCQSRVRCLELPIDGEDFEPWQARYLADSKLVTSPCHMLANTDGHWVTGPYSSIA